LIYFDRDPAPGSKKNWRCKLCGEYAHNRGNAMNHVEAKHLNVNYNCDQCTKSFRSRNSLKTHVSVYHSGTAPGSGSSEGAFNKPKLPGYQSPKVPGYPSYSTSPNQFKQGNFRQPYM